MRINRRSFLKLSAATAGIAILGGGLGYVLLRDPDPLADFYTSTFAYPLRDGWPPKFIEVGVQ